MLHNEENILHNVTSYHSPAVIGQVELREMRYDTRQDQGPQPLCHSVPRLPSRPPTSPGQNRR